MTATLTAAFFAGGALVAVGVFAAGWRRRLADALVAVPLLASGAAVCLAAVSRFGALRQDAVTGQELAALVAVAGLAAAVLGAAWSRGEPS